MFVASWSVMQSDNKASGKSASGAAAAPALDRGTLERRLAQASTSEFNAPRRAFQDFRRAARTKSPCCGWRTGYSRFLFLSNSARRDQFRFPVQLRLRRTLRSPRRLSCSTTSPGRTRSIFESIKPGGEKSEGDEGGFQPATIHKLMSAPVLDKGDKVLGVIQVCHKGFDLASAGPTSLSMIFSSSKWPPRR